MRTTFPLVLSSITALCIASGCGDSETTSTPPPTGLACGPGTIEQSGQCVPETNLACGENTFEFNGECVDYDPNDTTPPVTTPDIAAGAILDGSAVTLTTDEPAVIYYSTDGSAPGPGGLASFSPAVIHVEGLASGDVTMRYYAVDPADNTEAENEGVYSLAQPFEAVADFDVSVTGSDAVVNWTPPTGAQGVVVARVWGPLDGGPVDGATYAAGDTLPGGHEIVYVGTASTFSDGGLTPGLAHYAAWAQGEVGTYSRPRADMDLVAMAAQTGAIAMSAPNATFTVNSAPANIGVTGTVAFGAPTLTATITLQNNTTRPLYNAKLMVSNLSTGNVDNDDGSLGGTDYIYFDEALMPGESTTQDLVVDSVLATDTVTADIEVVDHAMVVVPSQWTNGGIGSNYTALVDAGALEIAGKNQDHRLARTFVTGPGGSFNYYDAEVTLDGQHVFVGYRHAPQVSRLSVGTREIVGTTALSSERGSTCALALDRNRNLLYALLTLGRHAYHGNTHFENVDAEVFVVKLDAGTGQELGRLQLEIADPTAAHVLGRTMALSNDNTMLVAAVGTEEANGALHFIDTATFTEIDTDGNAANGVTGLNTTPSVYPRSLLFSTDDAQLYVGGNRNGTDDMVRVNVSSFAITPINFTGVAVQTVSSLLWGEGGLLYAGSTNSGSTDGIFVYNPMDQSTSALPYASDAGRMVLGPGGNLLVQRRYYEGWLDRVDPTNGATIESLFTGHGAYGDGLKVTPY